MDARRSIEILDLLRLRYVSDPQIHPIDDEIVYVVTSTAPKTWEYRLHLHLVGRGSPRALTRGRAQHRAPRWSPDGARIAFVSDRSGRPQVWVMSREGTDAVCLTDLPLGVTGAPQWTPEGKTIVFSAHQVVGAPDHRPGEPVPAVRVIRTLDDKTDPTGVAHGARSSAFGFRDYRRQHIWAASSSGGSARQLTEGDFDHLRPAVSPDGRLVAFVANRIPDADRTLVRHIWTVPVDGGDLTRVAGGWGPISDIAWSPQGDRLAFVGHLRGDKGQDRLKPEIYAVDAKGGDPVCITDGFEPTLGVWPRGDFRWPDSTRKLLWVKDGLYFIASDRDSAHLFRASDGEIARVVGGPRVVFSFSVAPTGRIAFAAQDAVHPGDVFSVDAQGCQEQRTWVNAGLLRHVTVTPQEHFTFKGTLDQDVDAWIMRPASCEPGRRYPLILQTHRGSHGHAFHFEHQVLAARGYAVLYCNKVGAQGYGQAYALAQDKVWGGRT